jgi:hypothetical protein
MDTQTILLIIIASSTALTALLTIFGVIKLVSTLRRVDEMTQELRERATGGASALGYIGKVVEAGFNFYELWRDRKTK